MLDDLRAALRSLRSAPAFTVVALVVLALGTGAGAAIFSVVDAVVLRGLPFDQHDRLAAVLEHDTLRPDTFGGGTTTSQMYLDWRGSQQPFESVAASAGMRFELRNDRGEPEDARGLRVTHEFFPTLRARPLLGRLFTAGDEAEGAHRVVVLSHGFWQRWFGGSRDVVGRTMPVGAETYEIVGVLPRGFEYPVASDRPTEMFVPAMFATQDRVRGGGKNYTWSVIARLKSGVSFGQAGEQMNGLMARLDEEHPKWSPGRRARVVSVHEHLVGDVRGWMLMLLGAVALVLLIACANVANLMLARASVRARETGIRAALGASRWRLARGLLVESVVLSVLGAGAGVLLAWAGVKALTAWLPPGLPRVAAIGIDLRVLGAACAAALVTGIVFGVVPAFQASRADLASALKDSGRSSTAGRRSQAFRGALVVAEVALAVVLLVGAGLFIGSFATLMRVDPGFDYRGVLALDVSVRANPDLSGREAWDDMSRRGGPYVEEVLAAVRGVPGIEMAGAVSNGLPLSGSWSRTVPGFPGRPKPEGDDAAIDQRTVTPNYLQVMRIPLRRGRHLSDADTAGSEQVAIVNEAAARRYWPGEDPLGQRIEINGRERVVVGIFGDIRNLGPEKPARQEVYLPVAQQGAPGMTIVARAAGRPHDVLPAVKAAIWSVNRDQRLTAETVTLEGYMERLIAERRFTMALLALFGVLGLVIAAAGIYGVMAYIVAQRTGEIGVRMALGATRAAVVGMVMRRAGVLVAAGLGLGAAAAWPLAVMVEAFLFQVAPHDVRIFAAVLATLAGVGLLASAIPARRASAVDPLVALRHE